MALLGSGAPEAQDCGVGALANLAVNPRCRELIADANAIAPLVQLLGPSDVGDGVKEMAVGTLTNLAILPANQVTQDAPEGLSDGTAIKAFLGKPGCQIALQAMAQCQTCGCEQCLPHRGNLLGHGC